MANLKIAAWNIYFSWKMVKRNSGGRFSIPSSQSNRAEKVGEIVRDMDVDALGIIESMGEAALEFYCKTHCPEYDGFVINESVENYGISLIYKRSSVKVRKLPIDVSKWKAKIGDDRGLKTYKFTRSPLVVKVTSRASNKSIVLCFVHAKSKRPRKQPDDLTPQERERRKRDEAVRNRKRIVAEVLRVRELLYRNYDKFIILGDINDGPDFDEHEQKIWRSGIESLLGSVLDPDNILHSFVDMSDGKGEPTCSFRGGTIQLDHIVYTPNMRNGQALPKIKKGTGKVRSDLVDLSEDGKNRDSDHAPVEVEVRF